MTAQTFLLPDLGEGLTEAVIVKWLVSVGDTVSIDQAIAEVETAKSIVDNIPRVKTFLMFGSIHDML